jgi:tellurite resistance protein TerC
MNEYINLIASWVGFDLNMPHIEVPTGLSLLIIFGTLLLSMGLSYVVTKSSTRK